MTNGSPGSAVNERLPDELGSVRGYAAVVAGCSPGEIAEVLPLGDGENHRVYKVSYRDGLRGPAVVRIGWSDSGRDLLAASREAAVLRMVGGLAGPRLLDFDARGEWFDAPAMCMEFVDGAQRPPSALVDFKRLGRVVGLVHGLASGDLADVFPDSEATIDEYVDTRLRKLTERLPWIRDPLPAAVQARLWRALDALSELTKPSRASAWPRSEESLVLLHGDVAGGNILWNPRPLLIDWEYARLGDPADEVAYIFVQHGSSAEQQDAFWQGYRRCGTRPRAQLVDRTRWWEPVTLMGSTAFWVEAWCRRLDACAAGDTLAALHKVPEFYGEQTFRRLDQLERLLIRTTL